MHNDSPLPLVDNPFVKPENHSWQLSPPLPTSLKRSISPPPTNRSSRTKRETEGSSIKPTTAAVEAGELEIRDHVSFFSSKLLAATRPGSESRPRLSHNEWLAIYRRNLNDRGHHFVVHQHDHPVAGTHYDLRLQCNATSSISFAIMYGLPGDPNSRRLNRNATETRVHNLWNHLIETASHDTGTMLIWDTGEYTVLPYHSSTTNTNSDASTTDSDSECPSTATVESEPSKLHRAFQNRKIKLRLHGTRLPQNYTISLRLTHENNRVAQPAEPAYKRRRKAHHAGTQKQAQEVETSDSSRPSSPTGEPSSPIQSPKSKARPTSPRSPRLGRSVSSLHRTASPPSSKKRSLSGTSHCQRSLSSLTARERPSDPSTTAQDDASEQQRIRRTNAYPGATNSVNSIHQRKWYLSLDRTLSGFRPSRSRSVPRVWERIRTLGSGGESEMLSGFESFHVLGREVETSVVTGRTAADIARDEGLEGYKPRGGWKAVVE